MIRDFLMRFQEILWGIFIAALFGHLKIEVRK